MKQLEIDLIEQVTESFEKAGFDLESHYFNYECEEIDDFIDVTGDNEIEYDLITITRNEPDLEPQLQGYNLELAVKIADYHEYDSLQNKDVYRDVYINCFNQLP